MHLKRFSLAVFLSVFSPFLLAPGVSTADPASDAVVSIKSVEVSVSPLIPKSATGERNIVVVSIDSSGLSNVTVRLSSVNWTETKTQSISALAKGKQPVGFEIAPLVASVPVTVQIQNGDQTREFGPFTVSPPRKWTVYLTQHTHTDIGYTRPQTEILPEHLRYIDYALDYCDLTDNLPEDARYRWTCETTWAVREYLKDRPASQIARLKKRVQEGRIEICGMLLNMSEIATENSLAALVRPLRAIKDEFGIPVRTAMQNDVNGAGWCLPDYFNGIGIHFITMGINKTRSILPFDKPTCFWWESPSGKRVLAYRSDHYMTANFWGVEKGDAENFKPGMINYLTSLQDLNYPFDRVGVQFSGYFTDNSPPSTAACNLVKVWNEKYAWPKLRLSTAQEFLSWVEKEKGDQLEVHRQAWPDWWTDGFASAARETAAARETETAMDVNHGLFTMASLLGSPIRAQTRQHAAAIQDNLLFYHEHTYGAAESISDPLAENAQVQWGEKASFVWSAVKESALLHEEALGLVQEYLPRAEVPTIAVLNTLNWPRSGMVRVFIDHQMLHPDREFRILDGAQPVLAQEMERRTEGTYWALWVKDVPPLGCKMLRIETSDHSRAKAKSAKKGVVLENAFYKLTVDPAKGSIQSLIDKDSGAELVDQTAQWGLGQCLYETMPADRDIKPGVFKRSAWRNVKVTRGANGPIWKSLRLNADMDGCATTNGVQAEIQLYDTEKRIELHFAMRKLPVPTPEAVYVPLPFRSPDGKMLYEAQGGMVTPGQDQLPGSASDWQTMQSFISIRNADGQIILGSQQAPLVQLGDFNMGKWMPSTKVSTSHIYSWVMNNYWFTNFRTEQEGEFKWHYYLTSSKDTSTGLATRFGWGSRVPFATRVFAPGKDKSSKGETRSFADKSALNFCAPNLLLVESRPAADGKAVVLHLREIEGKTVSLSKKDFTSAAKISRVEEINVLEERLKSGSGEIAFQPFEAKFVRVVLR